MSNDTTLPAIGSTVTATVNIKGVERTFTGTVAGFVNGVRGSYVTVQLEGTTRQVRPSQLVAA